MKRHAKRTVLFIFACIFLMLGVAGLVLPILQGILFLAVGLVILSALSATVRDWLEKHTRKFPKVHKIVRDVEAWVVRIIGEV